MIRHFAELFRIVLKHNFYADGQGRGLQLVPSTATLRIMQQYGMQWGVKKNEYIMLFAQNSDASTQLPLLETPKVLRFLMQCTDPYFLNITKIPFFHSAEKLLYFDNLKPAPSLKKTIPLAQADQVSENDFLLINGVFTYKPESGKILTLRNARLQVLANQQDEGLPWTKLAQTDPAVFQVDLRKLPPGKYGLEFEPNQFDWFYYAEPERKLDHIGVVDIYIDKEATGSVVLPAMPVDESDRVKTFQLQFEARSTLWRYFVINRSQLDFDRLEVSNVGKNGFTEAAPQLLRSGTQTAIPVFSEKPLPLQEQQPLKPKLNLIKKSTHSEFDTGPIVFDLPTPNWQNITPERKDGKQNEERVIYSDMYIYL